MNSNNSLATRTHMASFMRWKAYLQEKIVRSIILNCLGMIKFHSMTLKTNAKIAGRWVYV